MCGIAGSISFKGTADKDAALMMNELIKHRGPDGEGVYEQENVFFAHRRLSIIDVEGGAQPFIDGDCILNYNGEIYNYKEIQEELSDVEFKTSSDTEVLIKAYQKWGIDCLQKLRGMFAFALLDKKAEKVFIVRDRPGIKPLFYSHTDDQLFFCSELYPLSKIESVDTSIDTSAIKDYFALQYIPTPKTIYKGIKKLEAAHYLEIDLKESTVKKYQYWDLPLLKDAKSEEQWVEELNEILHDTVNIYARSDVPFGSFLSGGVDSSVVTAELSTCLTEPVRTFSIGFQEREVSELPYAKKAAEILKTDHFEKIVYPDFGKDFLIEMIRHFGEPFADSSSIPTYYVSKIAAEQVKMVLTGDGGDELFAGYDSYVILHQLLTHSKSKVITLLREMGFDRMPILSRKIANNKKLLNQVHRKERLVFSDAELKELLNEKVKESSEKDVEWLSEDALANFQYNDFLTYLSDDVLTKVDRMSMANSLETRVPLLDHKIIELAFQIPTDILLKEEEEGKIITKRILKESGKRYFTDEFLNRKKQGFGIPVQKWCGEDFKSIILEGIENDENKMYEYLNKDYVQQLAKEYYSGNESLVSKIWFIFMFDLWINHVHEA